jgi:DmsE family decaheme c-type cytochrome
MSDCAMCHEDVVAAFQRTGHARARGWDPATGCQSCHGPGDEHINAGGDPEKIVRPQLLSPRESSDGCLGCHSRHEGFFSSAQSMHRLDEIGCLDCHNPHLAGEGMLVDNPVALCADCHQASSTAFDLPRAHPIEEDGPGCTGCHDPHATRSLRGSGAAVTRTCESCHFEITGPYVYDHGVLLTDGCGSCHEAHGSTNRHLLTHDLQVNLCYECHSGALTPGWHSASRYVNQKCTSCHSAIHGSNTSQFFLED